MTTKVWMYNMITVHAMGGVCTGSAEKTTMTVFGCHTYSSTS